MNKKVSSLTFRPLKYLPTYLQKCEHEESILIRNYTLQTKQVGVHTTLESYNCAATYDQSSTTTNICYVPRTRLPISVKGWHTGRVRSMTLSALLRIVVMCSSLLPCI